MYLKHTKRVAAFQELLFELPGLSKNGPLLEGYRTRIGTNIVIQELLPQCGRPDLLFTCSSGLTYGKLYLTMKIKLSKDSFFLNWMQGSYHHLIRFYLLLHVCSIAGSWF